MLWCRHGPHSGSGRTPASSHTVGCMSCPLRHCTRPSLAHTSFVCCSFCFLCLLICCCFKFHSIFPFPIRRYAFPIKSRRWAGICHLPIRIATMSWLTAIQPVTCHQNMRLTCDIITTSWPAASKLIMFLMVIQDYEWFSLLRCKP